MRYYLIILLLSSSLRMYGQNGMCDFIPNEKNTNFIVNGDYQINSNGFNNSFIKKYWSNDNINITDIDEVISNLNDKNNTLGGSYSYSVSTFFKTNNEKKYGFLFSVGNEGFLEIDIEKSLFELYFTGNQRFAGETVEFDNMVFNIMHYQFYKTGIWGISEGKMTTHKWVVLLGINRGIRSRNVNVVDASLFTENMGMYLDLKANFNFSYAGNVDDPNMLFRGIGPSLDFSYNNYKETGREFGVNIKSLGFINWNKKNYSLDVDTAFRFGGLDLFNLQELGQGVENQSFRDSVLSPFFRNYSEESYNTNLPLQISIYSKIPFSKNMLFSLYISKYVLSKTNPFVYSGIEYIINDNFLMSSGLSYGGFGKMNFGIKSRIKIKEFVIDIGTDFLSGYIFKKTSAGQGLYLSLRKEF